MSELKPCPFCGGKAQLGTAINFRGTEYYVACSCCAINFTSSREEAISKWNHRNYTADVQQAIDKQKPELAIITKELGYHPDGDVYEVGCPDCGKVLRYVNFVRGATTDCIRHCMDCGKKMNVRIDAEVEDE